MILTHFGIAFSFCSPAVLAQAMALLTTGLHLDGEREVAILSKAWAQLRLAVRARSRFAAWDALVVTAASPDQAHMYNW